MRRECSNQDSLGRIIYITAQEIKNFAEKVLQPHGLTLEQFHILKNMERYRGLSQRELGSLVSKTPANISRLLDRLESKAMVVRRENPADRRAALVFLTPAGDALVKNAVGVLESFSHQLTKNIPASQQELVRNTLNTISGNIQAMSANLATQD